MKKYILIIILFIITILLVVFTPSNSSNNIKNSKIYINEIMASNSYTIMDDYNSYSDYIEIYNGYKYDIDLSGYYLSDDIYNYKKWEFPNIKIKSHEYLIIYASGMDTCNIETRVCHTNFKLSSKGEEVIFSDKNGNIISKISYSNMGNDISYGYNGHEYIYLMNPTPGKINDNTPLKVVNSKEYDVYITEYMTHNKGIVTTKDGYCYDFVELYNNSSSDATLFNMYLSDNINKLNKCKVPEVTIKSHEYLVIYLSGDHNYQTDEILCDFKLSDDDEYLILSNSKDIMDKVEIVKLNDNVSYGRVDKVWKYFMSPTPGYENNSAYFDTMGGNNGGT